MTAKWVNVSTSSIPLISEFNTTDSQGTPINLNQNGKAFALINNVIIPLNCMPIAITRAVLAAVVGQSFGDIYYLTEKGREGFFEWTAASVVAPTTVSLVAADIQGGIYIPPASDVTGASGAWVRIYSGSTNVKWFGATGNGVTDDSPAIIGAIAFLKAIAGNPITTIYKASGKLLIPAGKYNCATTTIEITHTLEIEGEGGNGFGSGGGAATMLMWNDGVTGIRVQEYNTSGASTVDAAPYHFTAAYTTLRGLYLYGGFVGVESESHGIHTKTKINLDDIHVDNFAGDGLYAHTSSGGGSPNEGSSNCSRVYNSHFRNCRDGLSITGGDANAWLFLGCLYDFNRRWGVNDTSFLGNTYIGCHEDANSITTASAAFGASVVSYSGNRYACVYGQETNASVNAPSGNTTDTAYWYYCSAGGVAAPAIPAWVNGMTLRAGGPMLLYNANANSVVSGNYVEGGQGPIQQTAQGMVIGGSNNTNVRGGVWIRGFTGSYFRTTSQITVGNFQQWQRAGESFILDGSTDATSLTNPEFNIKTGIVATGSGAIKYQKSDGTVMGQLTCIANFGLLADGLLGVFLRYNGVDTVNTTATGFNLQAGKVLQVNNVQVLTARKTGWALATGTANRATWDTGTVTLAVLAQTVKALIDDLHGTAGHGIIGT